ncbi:malate dehydrogenase [Candidatus Gastranaerophilus sp. (ex Termes propinquus)]|nr:malate dehydrogenase [Candidatus Gastranaerophilus sp. (ex Termes propinquus)]
MIEVCAKVEVCDKKTLALVYTPGVAESCLEIKEDYDRVFDLTNRSNSVAVVSYDYALSLKRAEWLKNMHGIDAYPFEIKKTTSGDLEFVCRAILPGFMGIDRTLLENLPFDNENIIPTRSKNCVFGDILENVVAGLSPIELRERFCGVIETRVTTGDIKKPVAIVTDGSAVLGLGNIGSEAGLPVMEGKAVLFKSLGNVSAMPICLSTQEPSDIVKVVQLLENSFSGVNLEDIAAPKCFDIERELTETTNIPIFHDDQHGTAIVVVAALLNALHIVEKEIADIEIVISGTGAAGQAVCKLLMKAGVKHIVMVDSKGILYKTREDNDASRAEMAKITNLQDLRGTLADAVVGTDVFVGVSAGGILKPEMVETMADGAIVFALANPMPEILPPEALEAGARIVGSGRSDFDNQINNSLAFPGLFKGVLASGCTQITDDIKLECAVAIASLVSGEELSESYIIPDALDVRVANKISACIINYVRNPNINA